MARPAKPIAKKYGKLRVIKETVEHGRRIVTVQCTCGTKKDVYADALRSGRTRSCGAAGCRSTASQIKFDRHYKPRGSDLLDEATVRRHYKRLTAKGPSKATVAQIADELVINYNTLYSIFRNIRKAGGPDMYYKRVREAQAA